MQLVCNYFLLFLLYSFIGWIIEMIVVGIESKKISDRGFLIGPICPIYGVGSIFMTIFLSRYQDDFFILFFMSLMICSIIEYITSFIMEKCFKTRWWDYSKQKFNLNGRVCLRNSIGFGCLGILLINFLNPFFINLINKIPDGILSIFAIILLIMFLVDVFVSFNIICKVKVATDDIRRDCTDEINKKVRGFIKEKSFLYKRLFKAFPNLKINIKLKKTNK